MAKVFNNTDKTIPSEGGLLLSGWERSAKYDVNRIARIQDTIGAGIAMEKMGTSIPDPFARMLLFDTAFGQTNTLGAKSDNVYTRLASECLDMLEFIYLYGDQIQIKPWNVTAELNALSNSGFEGHKKLAKALTTFTANLGVQDIYLIYHNGTLIGGTSPYTLVYTSPNMRRHLKMSDAKGIAGNPLFPDYGRKSVKPCPLCDRDEGFRKFMTSMLTAFAQEPRFANSNLRKYIFANQAMDDQKMAAYYATLSGATPFDMLSFRNQYDVLTTITGVPVDIFGNPVNPLPLAFKKKPSPISGATDTVPDDNVSRDYEIVPTANRHAAGPLPLVLSENGAPGAIYVGNKPLGQVVMTFNPEEPLEERILPGGSNIKYPYLTYADFLEETLLKMNYQIDDSNFKNLNAGHYLLPLKKRFFEYFNIDDINNPGSPLEFKIQELSKKVKVTLRIPIRNHMQPYIELTKEYDADEVKVLGTTVPSFDIAVFPSYQVESGVPNLYSVMLHDMAGNKLKARYYSLGNSSVDYVEPRASQKREDSSSEYTLIDKAFDLIEVEWENVHAILVPAFRKITPATTTKIMVAIDFGTTNTYVAWSAESGANPKSIDISRNDCQTLTLRKLDLSKGNRGERYMNSFGTGGSFGQALDREYIPLRIGKENMSDFGIPFRTATCETKSFISKGEPMLFADINIGFNLMKETVQLFPYATDIKWAYQIDDIAKRSAAIKRMKNFCFELTWLVKNKLMLNNPVSSFDFYVTFPYMMSRSQKNQMESVWREAFEFVMGPGAVTIHRASESTAPFYYQIGSGENFAENALNVDIGGATTDMLFADVKNKVLYYNSSQFAANDIWGDGKTLIEDSRRGQNGIIRYFEKLLSENTLNASDQQKDAYYSYKKVIDKSEDLMTYVFNNEEYLHFVENHKDHYLPVLVTHLAALIYHIAQVLKSKDIGVPSTVTFSGMGAKYIQQISSNDGDITELIKVMLSSFMGYGVKDKDHKMPENFKIVFQASPKQVTAQGALLEQHRNLEIFKDYNREPVRVYGFDREGSDDDIFYSNVSDYKQHVMGSFSKFIEDFFNNQELSNYLRKDFDIEYKSGFIKQLKDNAAMGFEVMKMQGNPDDSIDETLFFWPFKDGLFAATQTL